MIINQANIKDLFKAYNAAFKQGFSAATGDWERIATPVPSSTSENHYGWLGQFPALREWIGDRQVKNLQSYDYSIKNKKFESTVGVPRDDIEDDVYGVYSKLMESMGDSAKRHPDTLIFALLAAGMSTKCYDKQYFFDSDHPVNGQSVSNIDNTGSGDYWFLLDTRHPLKPLIFQKRRAYDFRSMVSLDDPQVFATDEFQFGVDARVNAGFGFWQQAFASNNTLNQDNFDTAWAAMSGFKDDEGKPLGIQPDLLVVGPSNRAAARKTIKVRDLAGGGSNPNFEAVDVLVTPYL